MKKTRRIPLTPELAHVPDALAAFLLHPERPLRYGWWTRFRDFWDGRRDRGNPFHDAAEREIPVADTPWLRRLFAECHNAVAQERARTEALVAVLDREIAALESQVAHAEEDMPRLEAEIQGREAEPVTDDVIGAGEIYSTSEERVRRRRHERAAETARLRRQIAAAQETLRVANERLDVVIRERQSHWIVMQERSRVLIEHYQRRASTYTRALERRKRGEYFTVPHVVMPDWASADLGAGGRMSAPMRPPLKLASSF